MQKSCFFSGPNLSITDVPELSTVIPSFDCTTEAQFSESTVCASVHSEHLVDIDKFSNFRRLVLVYRRVFLAFNK